MNRPTIIIIEPDPRLRRLAMQIISAHYAAERNIECVESEAEAKAIRKTADNTSTLDGWHDVVTKRMIGGDAQFAEIQRTGETVQATVERNSKKIDTLKVAYHGDKEKKIKGVEQTLTELQLLAKIIIGIGTIVAGAVITGVVTLWFR